MLLIGGFEGTQIIVEFFATLYFLSACFKKKAKQNKN
jgi:hypothetical protein